jgi:glutaminyl-peptide cyclotransferase
MSTTRRIPRRIFLMVSVCAVLAGCRSGAAENLAYRIVSERPHDPEAYTQGLQLVEGRLFESTGLYGKSTVREVDPATGEVLRKRPLSPRVFGEGLTLHNDELWVLTWKEQVAYVLEPDTFKFIRSHPYGGEGWGLTSDGKRLVMSDGSSTLKFIDATTFAVHGEIQVTDQGRPVDKLNELEWVDGVIFANIYTSDRIARISPETGGVTGWLDLSALRKRLPVPHRAEELNGIAFDAATGRLLVTGKNWPRLFEIELVK